MFLNKCAVVISVSFLHFISGLNGSQEVLQLVSDDVGRVFKIPKNSVYSMNIIKIPSTASVIICQVHSLMESLTISEEPDASIHTSVSGRNIGLALKLGGSDVEKQLWLLNSNPTDISVLISATSLNMLGPVPGGCNMEFPTEIAPYLKLKTDTMRLYLEYQHASFGFHRDEPHIKCSLSSPYVSYDIYMINTEENNFKEEEYFKKVELMRNLSSIKEYSSKAISYSLLPDTRYSFLMYPNVGTIYNVVAKYTMNNEMKESAYIPIASYGCSPNDFTANGCRVKFSNTGRIFLFVISFCGFVVAFFGYSSTWFVLAFFGLLMTSLISFILIGKYTSLSKETVITLSVFSGSVGATVFLLLWIKLQNLLILYLLNGFASGILFSSILFYTPIGNFEMFISITNCWSLLCIGTLTVAILSLLMPTIMLAIGSSVVGTYCMLLFYDDFAGTRLSYIILNVIKRLVSKDLAFAFNDIPFQTSDILMTTFWIFLSSIAMLTWYKRLSFSRNQLIYFRDYFTFSQSHDVIENSQQSLLRNNTNVTYKTF